jgi:hypothetical protein
MELSQENVCHDISGDYVFCRWCAEKENLKSQADQNCLKCKGDGYTVFLDHHTYPLPYDDEVMCPCQCLSIVKEVQC